MVYIALPVAVGCLAQPKVLDSSQCPTNTDPQYIDSFEILTVSLLEMAGGLNDGSTRLHTSRFARSYNVPDRLIVNVEHPCIIKNIEKGVESLGGESKIQKVSTSLQRYWYVINLCF